MSLSSQNLPYDVLQDPLIIGNLDFHQLVDLSRINQYHRNIVLSRDCLRSYFNRRLPQHPEEINQYLAYAVPHPVSASNRGYLEHPTYKHGYPDLADTYPSFVNNAQNALLDLVRSNRRDQLPFHLSKDPLLLQKMGEIWPSWDPNNPAVPDTINRWDRSGYPYPDAWQLLGAIRNQSLSAGEIMRAMYVRYPNGRLVADARVLLAGSLHPNKSTADSPVFEIGASPSEQAYILENAILHPNHTAGDIVRAIETLCDIPVTVQPNELPMEWREYGPLTFKPNPTNPSFAHIFNAENVRFANQLDISANTTDILGRLVAERLAERLYSEQTRAIMATWGSRRNNASAIRTMEELPNLDIPFAAKALVLEGAVKWVLENEPGDVTQSRKRIATEKSYRLLVDHPHASYRHKQNLSDAMLQMGHFTTTPLRDAINVRHFDGNPIATVDGLRLLLSRPDLDDDAIQAAIELRMANDARVAAADVLKDAALHPNARKTTISNAASALLELEPYNQVAPLLLSTWNNQNDDQRAQDAINLLRNHPGFYFSTKARIVEGGLEPRFNDRTRSGAADMAEKLLRDYPNGSPAHRERLSKALELYRSTAQSRGTSTGISLPPMNPRQPTSRVFR